MPLAAFRFRVLLAVAVLAVLVTWPAAAAPVFGPNVYTRTAGPPDVFNETFAAPAGGFLLWVVNGDDDGHRVTAGTIVLNGQTVAGESDFNANTPHFSKPVTLLGQNALTITLASEPGSFITLAVLPRVERPDLIAGRLLLPWANVSNLVLALKNGDHRFGRRVRVVLYNGAGEPVASSNPLNLPPRGSLNVPANVLLPPCGVNEGSLEIFYGGRGLGRVFGHAAVMDMHMGAASVTPLQQAGHRRLDGVKPPGTIVEPNPPEAEETTDETGRR